MVNNSTSRTLNGSYENIDDSYLLIGNEEDALGEDNHFSAFLDQIESFEKSGKDLPFSEYDLNISRSLNSDENLIPSPKLDQLNGPQIMNAVHMEIQDNAKIPTFLQPVDRSNSGNVNLHPRFPLKKTKSRSSRSQACKKLHSNETSNNIFREKKASDAHLTSFPPLDFGENDGGSSSSGSFNLTEMFLDIDER